MDADKYPPTSERRRFVKGVVGGSALSGIVSAAGAGLEASTSSPGSGSGSVTYRALNNTDGPAPRGMPQVPLEVDDDGYLKGVWPEPETKTLDDGTEVTIAKTEIAGVTYSTKWFQYCGVQTFRGTQPETDADNYIRHDANAGYDWQRDSFDDGAKVHVDDFTDYEEYEGVGGSAGTGKPAACTWRSIDSSKEEIIPVHVIRSQRITDLAEDDDWMRESTVQGCIANLNKCTHFCCVPGFKANADAAKFGGADKIYCQCHQSIYDPFNVVERSMTALPRPND